MERTQLPRRRLQDNIKMDLREIEQVVMDGIHVAEDMTQLLATVKRVIKIRVQYDFWKFLSSCAAVGFSRRARPRRLN
jgi:hypothetical protein